MREQGIEPQATCYAGQPCVEVWISAPDTYTPGVSFDITITMKNTNTSSAGPSYLDVSFPQNPAVSIVSRPGWDTNYGTAPFAPGDQVYHKTLGWISAQHRLVSSRYSGSWSFNAQRQVVLRVTTSTGATGPLEIYYRGTIANQVDPQSGTPDQQGWWVKVHTMTTAKPNLQVTSYSVDDTLLFPGDAVSTWSVVSNTGAGSARSSRLHYYLSTDAAYSRSDVFLDYDSVSSLAATATSSESETLTIPPLTSNGSYAILFQADGQEVVDETIDDDNVSSRAVTVTRPTLSDNTLNSYSAAAGSSITLNYLICNTDNETRTFGLGASLFRVGSLLPINDSPHDRTETVPGGLCQWKYREFEIPTTTSAGTYDVVWGLHNQMPSTTSLVYLTAKRTAILTITPAVTTLQVRVDSHLEGGGTYPVQGAEVELFTSAWEPVEDNVEFTGATGWADFHEREVGSYIVQVWYTPSDRTPAARELWGSMPIDVLAGATNVPILTRSWPIVYLGDPITVPPPEEPVVPGDTVPITARLVAPVDGSYTSRVKLVLDRDRTEPWDYEYYCSPGSAIVNSSSTPTSFACDHTVTTPGTYYVYALIESNDEGTWRPTDQRHWEDHFDVKLEEVSINPLRVNPTTGEVRLINSTLSLGVEVSFTAIQYAALQVDILENGVGLPNPPCRYIDAMTSVQETFTLELTETVPGARTYRIVATLQPGQHCPILSSSVGEDSESLDYEVTWTAYAHHGVVTDWSPRSFVGGVQSPFHLCVRNTGSMTSTYYLGPKNLPADWSVHPAGYEITALPPGGTECAYYNVLAPNRAETVQLPFSFSMGSDGSLPDVLPQVSSGASYEVTPNLTTSNGLITGEITISDVLGLGINDSKVFIEYDDLDAWVITDPLWKALFPDRAALTPMGGSRYSVLLPASGTFPGGHQVRLTLIVTDGSVEGAEHEIQIDPGLQVSNLGGASEQLVVINAGTTGIGVNVTSEPNSIGGLRSIIEVTNPHHSWLEVVPEIKRYTGTWETLPLPGEAQAYSLATAALLSAYNRWAFESAGAGDLIPARSFEIALNPIASHYIRYTVDTVEGDQVRLRVYLKYVPGRSILPGVVDAISPLLNAVPLVSSETLQALNLEYLAHFVTLVDIFNGNVAVIDALYDGDLLTAARIMADWALANPDKVTEASVAALSKLSIFVAQNGNWFDQFKPLGYSGLEWILQLDDLADQAELLAKNLGKLARLIKIILANIDKAWGAINLVLLPSQDTIVLEHRPELLVTANLLHLVSASSDQGLPVEMQSSENVLRWTQNLAQPLNGARFELAVANDFAEVPTLYDVWVMVKLYDPTGHLVESVRTTALDSTGDFSLAGNYGDSPGANTHEPPGIVLFNNYEGAHENLLPDGHPMRDQWVFRFRFQPYPLDPATYYPGTYSLQYAVFVNGYEGYVSPTGLQSRQISDWMTIPVQIVDSGVPDAPALHDPIEVSEAGDMTTLSWSIELGTDAAPLNRDVAGYLLYRATSADQLDAAVPLAFVSGDEFFYQDTFPFALDQVYYYAVKAVDLKGAVSPLSAPVAVTPNSTPCHVLELNHIGNGAPVIAYPTHSATCGYHEYTVGEVLSLAASPYVGWALESWTGTDDDLSTEETNTLTMPDTDHAVSVVYVQVATDTWTPTHTGTPTATQSATSTSTATPTQTPTASATATSTSNPGIVVTNLNDSGPGSLRQAIVDALPGGSITFALTGDILVNSMLAINKNLAIVGPSAPGIRLVRQFSDTNSGVLYIEPGAAVGVANLSIVSQAFNGHGILSLGDLTLSDSAVIGGNIPDSSGINQYRGVGYPPGGRLTIINATIAGFYDGIGLFGLGYFSNITVSSHSDDGLAVSAGATATVKNSIISAAGDKNCEVAEGGSLVSVSTNLSSDATCSGFTLGNTDPRLGSLGAYGGSSNTIPLLQSPMSPAIDAAISCTDVDGVPIMLDQRGYVRPVDGDGSGSATCDLGAFEAGAAAATETPTPTPTDPPGVVTALAEHFGDGDYTSNPTWVEDVAPNNNASVMNGVLNVNGRLNDESGRYNAGFHINTVAFTTADLIDMSFNAQLLGTGNPQEGRNVQLTIYDTVSNKSVVFNLSKGFVGGWPTDRFQVRYSLGDGTLHDIVTTSYAPNRDQWYALRVVRQGGTWSFYVDGALVGMSGSDPLGGQNSFNWVSLNSVGSVQIDDIVIKVMGDGSTPTPTQTASVTPTRTPTPTASITLTPSLTPTNLPGVVSVLAEHFSDGDYTSNPTWVEDVVPNNNASVVDGVLNVNGRLNDQSGRYNAQFHINTVAFTTTDLIDMSFNARLLGTGSPQEGRNVQLTIYDTVSNKSVVFNLSKGFVGGWPTDRFQVRYSLGDGTVHDIVTTTYAPNRDQWYALRVVRQGGTWSFYIDGALAGTMASDPLGGLNSFNWVSLNSVGSVQIDDIVIKVMSDGSTPTPTQTATITPTRTPTPTASITLTPSLTPTNLPGVFTALAEHFSDGDYTSNPTWVEDVVPNNNASVADGVLNVNGRQNDGSGRYNAQFHINTIAFTTTDLIDMSFNARLLGTGSPQEGRNVQLTIYDTVSNKSVVFNLSKGFVGGWPTDRFQVRYSLGDGTVHDIVTTTYAPNRDQWYALRVVRQGGTWSFYIDGALAGTMDSDPLGGQNSFNWVSLNSVGSVQVDDIVIKMHSAGPTLTPVPTLTATSTPTATPTFTVTPSDGSVDIALSPDMVTVGAGGEFDLSLEVRADAQRVDGVAAYLNFDPVLLEVISITASTEPFNVVLQNAFNNTLGRVDFSSGRLSPTFPSGTFSIATIRMRAKAETAGTPITFTFANPRRTIAYFAGDEVFRQAHGASIVINEGAVLYGHVSIQNHPVANEEVHVRITPTDGGDAVLDRVVTLDDSGVFLVGGFAPGTYTIWAKHAFTTSVMLENISLVIGSNEVVLPQMRGGDASGDNNVNIQDFSILASSFGASYGDVAYDLRADFNEDGFVNIGDFSLLASNFGSSGVP